MTKNYTYRYFGCFRLLLAVLVMLQHFSVNASPASWMLTAEQFEFGTVAVLVFFCLSGFVISEAADTIYRKRPFAFSFNRALRLVPHFLVAMTLCILLHYYLSPVEAPFTDRDIDPIHENIFTPKNIFFNYLGLLPSTNRFMDYAFITIVWTIQIEVVFYVIIFLCLAIELYVPFKRLPFGALLACLFIPFFIVSIFHLSLPMFEFVPYFSFGTALYFAMKGSKAAKAITLISLAGMAWEFLAKPAINPTLGFERNVPAQSAMLIFLIAMMWMLLQIRSGRFMRIDQYVGKFTYPLYLYHHLVFVTVTTILLEHTLGTYLMALGSSLVLAFILSLLIDPLVEYYRDKIRGKKLTT